MFSRSTPFSATRGIAFFPSEASDRHTCALRDCDQILYAQPIEVPLASPLCELLRLRSSSVSPTGSAKSRHSLSNSSCVGIDMEYFVFARYILLQLSGGDSLKNVRTNRDPNCK